MVGRKARNFYTGRNENPLTLMILAVSVLGLGGCLGPSRTNLLTITDRSTSGDEQRFHESFDEAFYDIDGVGNVDLVLRRARPAGEGRDRALVQIVHVRSVWNSIPGRTIASETQINGRLTYVIVSDGARSAFEGAGSVFYRKKKEWGQEFLVGRVERTHLRAVPGATSEPAIFERVELGGEFKAAADGRRVRSLINEMGRLQGRASQS